MFCSVFIFLTNVVFKGQGHRQGYGHGQGQGQRQEQGTDWYTDNTDRDTEKDMDRDIFSVAKKNSLTIESEHKNGFQACI